MLKAILQDLKRIAGMPDYSRYAEHFRTHHPDRPVPDERDYYEEFVKAKYTPGASRCC